VGAAGIRFFGPASKWRLSAAAGTGIKDLSVGSRRTPRFLPLFLCAGSGHAAATGCCQRSVEEAGAEKADTCETPYSINKIVDSPDN